MYQHLPPLKSLRSFEAAARHLSFTKAAEELLVTQGAVSRQVKNLELHLGTRLFLREANCLELTDYGRAILPAASLAFENIDKAIEMASRARSVIRLKVAPTFAVRWLMPRLAAFARHDDDIEVRPSITLPPDDFDTASFDAGIIYGDGSWPSLHATLLSEEVLTPVCAPALIERNGPIIEIGDLADQVLLHTTTDRRDWPLWLSAVNAQGIDGYDGPTFETLDMAVRVAEAGIGVALGDLSLVGEDIRDGKLVAPIDRPVHTGRGTYFVCPRENRGQTGLTVFRDWLVANAPIRHVD